VENKKILINLSFLYCHQPILVVTTQFSIKAGRVDEMDNSGLKGVLPLRSKRRKNRKKTTTTKSKVKK
jgi:hypothetical protein